MGFSTTKSMFNIFLGNKIKKTIYLCDFEKIDFFAITRVGRKKIFLTIIHKNSKSSFFGELIAHRYK